MPPGTGAGHNTRAMNHAQLPLPFPHRPSYAADFLAAPSNEAALAWLERTADWPDHRLALWGEPGCGKTHLMRLWAARLGARVTNGADLCGLPALPLAGGIALDDADTVADEVALLHLLNGAREARLPVLLAARTPPARWTVDLPDLASRLRAITVVEIAAPEESLLRSLLLRLLSERQLTVTPAVQDWLLVRLPRSPAALREAAVLLDREAMAAGKAVTKTIAASVVAQMQLADDHIDQLPCANGDDAGQQLCRSGDDAGQLLRANGAKDAASTS